MIIWFIIFFIILFVSLVLAYFSMRDYQEIPKVEKEYGIYLIRKPQFLTLQTLNTIFDLSKGKILSFERLFKGRSQALVIFGPKKILSSRFSEILGLLELEDYTKVPGEIVAWEVERRDIEFSNNNIFSSIPYLEADEHFFWQLIVNRDQGQIRAVFISQNRERKKTLVSQLENLGENYLKKVPRPLTGSQILENYRQRIFTPSQAFKVNPEEIRKIIGLPRK